MAHFAELDESGNVLQVVVVNNAELLVDGHESEARGVAFLASLYGHDRWRQTSYSGSIRRHFAATGYRYDSLLDAFIPPRPWQSWRLDASSCQWVPPVPYPADGVEHRWHEDSLSWVRVP